MAFGVVAEDEVDSDVASEDVAVADGVAVAEGVAVAAGDGVDAEAVDPGAGGRIRCGQRLIGLGDAGTERRDGAVGGPGAREVAAALVGHEGAGDVRTRILGRGGGGIRAGALVGLNDEIADQEHDHHDAGADGDGYDGETTAPRDLDRRAAR